MHDFHYLNKNVLPIILCQYLFSTFPLPGAPLPPPAWLSRKEQFACASPQSSSSPSRCCTQPGSWEGWMQQSADMQVKTLPVASQSCISTELLNLLQFVWWRALGKEGKHQSVIKQDITWPAGELGSAMWLCLHQWKQDFKFLPLV